MYNYKEWKNEGIPKSEELTFNNSHHTGLQVSSLIFVIPLIFLRIVIIKKYLNSPKLSLPN